MRSKTVTAATLLGASALLAFAPMARAGAPNGNGAQKSGLMANTGSSTSECQASTGESTNGWAILNKTGAPVTGAVSTFQGEVHLVGGAPGTTYTINVASTSNNMCMPVGSLTTNGQGIGNGHIPDQLHSPYTNSDGTYYVVLQDGMMNELFASGPMTVL